MSETVLVLCPPNMTAPKKGPNGRLGDRIHQLPAVKTAVGLYPEKTYVWPNDRIIREVFQCLDVQFIEEDEPGEVIKQATTLSVSKVFCLYADPSTCLPDRARDCDVVAQCHEIAAAVAPNNFSMPRDLDPRGRVPLWRRLVATVRPKVVHDLEWPSLPFLTPDKHAEAEEEENRAKTLAEETISQGKPVLVISPLSGAPKGTVAEQWWWALARHFHYGTIIVPVHHSELGKAQALFDGLKNVAVFATDLAQTVGLAALPDVRVLGIDGGRMNVVAASREAGVLCIYGEWPASAWALPNVVVRGPDLTPDEAIMAVP